MQDLNLLIQISGFENIGPLIITGLDHLNWAQPETQRYEIIQPVRKIKIETGIFIIILIFTSFILIFIIFFLLANIKKINISSKIFAAYLLTLVFVNIDWILYTFRFEIFPYFPHLFQIGYSFAFLTTPLLFLYVKSFTVPNFELKIRHLFHASLFVFDIALLIIYYHHYNAQIKRELYLSGSIFSNWYWVIRKNLLIDLQGIIYILTSLIALYSYRKKIKNYFSSIERIRLTWLNNVLIGILIITFVGIVKHHLLNFTDVYNSYLNALLHIISLTFVLFILYKGLQQPEIFKDIDIRQLNGKYKKSGLNDAEKQHYLEKLLIHMETSRSYLDYSLSLHDLASQINVSPYYLSQILNECLRQSFYDFVNSYQLKKSKEILANPLYKGKTILEILYNSGFNSKSVFNLIFKKDTGITPKEYRQRMLQN